jgi:hypothetical protein
MNSMRTLAHQPARPVGPAILLINHPRKRDPNVVFPDPFFPLPGGAGSRLDRFSNPTIEFASASIQPGETTHHSPNIGDRDAPFRTRFPPANTLDGLPEDRRGRCDSHIPVIPAGVHDTSTGVCITQMSWQAWWMPRRYQHLNAQEEINRIESFGIEA